MGSDIGWRFDNTYARLPSVLWSAARPAPYPSPRVSILNHKLADELGLNLTTLSTEEAAALFAGQTIPDGSQPIAQAYAGHQYGGFSMLGDGRAILLGEHRTPSGKLVDIQFKGSGPTRYSRRGDGLAALGPMLREYIISEAMAALGIPTTRSLAVVATGETIFRTLPQRGAILTRVAASHLRVGTFEFVARQDAANVPVLADYAIQRHYPELSDSPHKYREFFRAVLDRQASLIARWQLVGFIHGVMNTDNMAISGETIDYGPCAFMNAYDPATVFSSIDRDGRYAYGNQPAIAQWNLARLAETLLPLFDADPERAVALAMEDLNEFPAKFEAYWLAGMRAKLGLRTSEDGDREWIQSLLDWMEQSKADFTNTFRDLSQEQLPADERYQDPEFQAWHIRWRERISGDGPALFAAMKAVNPAVIPRNHRVEEALTAAEQQDDLSVMERLLAVLASPFVEGPDSAMYREPPADDRGYRTYCGT
ncbi:YdiU family protein [soil metagenome]